MKKLEITDLRVQQAIALYKSGKAVRPICKELKMDGETLRRFLIQEGLLRTRQKSVQIGRGKYSVKDDVFDILTPEVLYWIGFLYADGHIEKDRPRITITLPKEDLPHLERFAAFTGSTVRMVTGGYYRVCFSSQQIHDRLISLGFTNRKTYNITPHESLKHSRDFWRGVVDGDGWIYKTTCHAIGLSGHEVTIQEFLSFVKLSGIFTKTSCRKVKNRNYLWTCDIHANPARQVAHLLYKDATVYLDRKYQTYLTEFSEPPAVAA